MVTCCPGCGRGAILGPILFLVVRLSGTYCMIGLLTKFAADTKMGKTLGNEDRLRLQTELTRQINGGWPPMWPSAKSCTNIVHKKPGFEYTVNRQLLVSTDVKRDTGVMVSKSLKPSAQRPKAAWTAVIVIGQINRVFLFR